MSVRAIKDAYEAVGRAEQQLKEIIERELPVGSEFVYTHGDNQVSARVIRHAVGDRIYVEGLASGKTYWIGAYRVLFRLN